MIISGKEIKGAIFDVDGTLLDSMPVWKNVGNEYLLRKGITPRENLAETFKTMSLEESAAYYQDYYSVKETSEEIINGVLSLIEEAYATNIPLKDGVEEFLKGMEEQMIPMYIATATDVRLIEAALKRTGIYKYFRGIVTCGQVGYGKEYPNVYDVARNELHTSTENTLVVEDAVYAVRTAKKAGYVVLGIYDAAEDEELQLKELADVYISSWKEIREIEL